RCSGHSRSRSMAKRHPVLHAAASTSRLSPCAGSTVMLPEPRTGATGASIKDAAERYTARLRRDGWCIVPDAMPIGTVGALDRDLEEAFEHTPFCEGGFYGRRTKRFGRLL